MKIAPKINNIWKRILIPSLFLFISCQNERVSIEQIQEDEVGKNHLPAPKLPAPEIKDCKAQLISNGDCFYDLPEMKNNETFTGSYIDVLKKDTKGITLGRGYWLCQNGIWETVSAPLCFGCKPGRSLEQCKEKWAVTKQSF